MLDLIWDLFQQGDIDRLESDRKRQAAAFEGVQQHAGSTEARLLELEKRHEQLKLVTFAMWRLLKDHAGLTEADLRKYVQSTDLLDGKSDGKVDLTSKLIECAGCGRFIFNTAIVCPYCSRRQESGNAFDGA